MKTKIKGSVVIAIIAILLVAIVGCNPDSTPPHHFPIEDSQTIKELLVPILVETGVNRVVVEDYLVDLDGNTVRNWSSEYSVGEGVTNIEHDLKFFGKHILDISYYNNSSLVDTRGEEVISTSDSYNVAPMIATVPALYFTLLDLDEDYNMPYFDSSIPTIIMLERQDAYNWDELPSNMMACPFLSDDEIQNGTGGDAGSFDNTFWEYIDYLYKLNPSSKFNFYGNDYWQGQMYDLLDLHIPLDQLKFVFFSDGSGTYSAFRSIYGDGSGTDNSLSKYNELKANWDTIKDLYNKNDDSYRDLLGSDFMNARGYLSVLVNDETDIDAYWIVRIKSENNFGSSDVYTNYIAQNERVIGLDMNNLFNDLSDSEKETFKKLYSIDTSLIENTDKPILIFLGTSTDSESNLREYLIATKAFFEEQYDCYYKGHPGHVNNNPENRNETLEELGVKVLDAAIPAELFSFYFDDVVYAGYPSSTLQNVNNPCVFLTFVGTKTNEVYMNRVESYLEKLGEGNFRIVKDYLTENPQYAMWNGSDDISTLNWQPYQE